MLHFHQPVFVALMVVSGLAWAVQDCDIGGVPVNPANGHTTLDKTGIMRCHDRDSGQLQREQELRQGKFVGLVRFYRDGRLEKEFSVNEQGNRHGPGREFSTLTGKVIREDLSRNGSSIGPARSFYPDGQLRRLSFRDDAGRELAAFEYTGRGQLRDMRCGDKALLGQEVDEAGLCGFGPGGTPVVTALYGEKGELRARLTHSNGVRVASETFWDSGKLRSQEETTSDGSQVERSFAQDGIKRQEVRWVQAERGRQKEFEQEFHDSGALVRERRWQAGEMVNEKTFFLNGQPRSDTGHAKRAGVAATDVREFHDNGKLAFQGSFLLENRSSPRAIGEHRRYDSSTRLRQMRSFDGKGRLTREQEFDASGLMTRDDEVFEDGSRKALAVPRSP